MNCTSRCSLVGSSCLLALVAVAGTIALAQPKDSGKPAAPATPPEMKLPEGWTPEDMQACMAAGMPGKMHEWLATHNGTWTGKTQMWMAPGTEPMSSTCTETVSMIMDGHYSRCDMSGEMPGMGSFTGQSTVGFDNVTQKFVGTWIDSQGTGIMNGEGTLSADHKTLTWRYTVNCPIAKKQVVMRQIETYTSPTTMTMEMWGNDPKSGKEFKCMHIELTKSK